MILERSMVEATLFENGVKWSNAATADDIVARFRDSRRLLLALDGFMGAGKSPFGSMLEWRFARRCLRMDRYLSTRPNPKQPSLIERLDLDRLRHDLSSDLNEAPALIEGALMRDLLERLGVVALSDVFHVYVAGAWKPDNTRVTWPDANQLESEQGHEPHRQIVEYHRRQRPHECFDAAVLRDQDELGKTGRFTAPDGQTFVVGEDVWPRARLDRIRLNRWAYRCSREGVREEPIGLIQLPQLSDAKIELDNAQFAHTLKAIHSQIPLPPILVDVETSDRKLPLLEGIHRCLASVAAGLTFIPTVMRVDGRGPSGTNERDVLAPAVESPTLGK